MPNRKQCVFNWSGGKDSTLALHYVLNDPNIEVKYLLTTVTSAYNRVSMHGIREALLIKQAESLGIPLYIIKLGEMPDMQTYDTTMHKHLTHLKQEGITHAIFGDIFLEDLRTYREEKLKAIGMEAIFPLWQKDTKALITEFLNLNYKTIVCCAQKNLKSLCGKVITAAEINALPKDVDPCGENGEFHTFAFEGPIFKKKIHFSIGEMIFRTYKKPSNSDDDKNVLCSSTEDYGFWYIDLLI